MSLNFAGFFLSKLSFLCRINHERWISAIEMDANYSHLKTVTFQTQKKKLFAIGKSSTSRFRRRWTMENEQKNMKNVWQIH